MRAVLQRVNSAQVTEEERVIGKIGFGLLVFLGISRDDSHQDADYLIEKSIHLRIFEDEEGKMNLSLIDTGGAMLVVSQFTLLADCRKGRRPSFIAAAAPETARDLYDYFVEEVEKKGVSVATGEFQALMDVSLVNHGPVTVLLDSRKVF